MKKQIITVSLLTMLLLPQVPVQATEALLVYPVGGGAAQSTALDDIQRLTFADDNLLLKTYDGSESPYSLATVRKVTIEDVTITGIPVTENTPDITVYPNPATDAVIIDGDILAWTLLDFNGKMLKQGITLTVPIDNLPAGIYLLKINTAKGSVTKKIIKQ